MRTTGSRRRLAAALLALAVAMTVGACGVPRDDEVHLISPKRVPHHLVAPSPPASPAAR